MKIFLGIAIVIVALLLIEGVRLYILLRKSADLVEKSLPYQRTNQNASMQVLVAGDSTAVGTGAANNTESTAGRLATHYPDAAVTNLAENGLRIHDLIPKLEKIPTADHFDIVLIQIGANDIIRFTPIEEIEKDVELVMQESTRIGQKVVILHSGDIGESPFFPWFIRPLLTSRSLKMKEIYVRAADAHGVAYVDLIDSAVGQAFASDPARYYANDLLHLSGDGYGLWFDEIKKSL